MSKQKYLFKVIAIAIMVVMVAVACKKKPTGVNATVDVGEEITPPIQPEGPKVKIDPNGDLKQFLGYYYESGGYQGISGVLVFTARVGRDDKQAYIEFEDGFKFYQGAGPACKGANYKLLIESLEKINDSYDPLVITNILELKYLEYLGVMPVLDKCSICGSNKGIATLSSYSGGYVCNNCLTNEKIVSEKTIKIIRMFFYVDISKISNIDISNLVKKEINDFLDDYYDRYTGLYLKSKSLLKNINKVG